MFRYKYTHYEGDNFIGWVRCNIVERTPDENVVIIEDENGKRMEFIPKKLNRTYEDN